MGQSSLTAPTPYAANLSCWAERSISALGAGEAARPLAAKARARRTPACWISPYSSSTGNLAMPIAMRGASSLICRCISSLPSLFRLQTWTELNNSSATGAARLGGSCHAWGDARRDRALACLDCHARFAGARCCYQSHTMRALWAVAYLTNALQVRLRVAARSQDVSLPAGVAYEAGVSSHRPTRAAGSSGFQSLARVYSLMSATPPTAAEKRTSIHVGDVQFPDQPRCSKFVYSITSSASSSMD
jgi:hypothetical protein